MDDLKDDAASCSHFNISSCGTTDCIRIMAIKASSSLSRYATVFGSFLNLYLGDDSAQEREALICVCRRDDAQNKELLRGYVRDAMRLNPQFGVLGL